MADDVFTGSLQEKLLLDDLKEKQRQLIVARERISKLENDVHVLANQLWSLHTAGKITNAEATPLAKNE